MQPKPCFCPFFLFGEGIDRVRSFYDQIVRLHGRDGLHSCAQQVQRKFDSPCRVGHL
jgi:hypothetical protein